MKKALNLPFWMLALGFLLSFQSFAQNKIPQNIGNFSALKVSSGIDVYLSQGTATSLEIEGHKDLVKHLIVELDKNNTLILRMDKKVNWKMFNALPTVKAHLTFTDLQNIRVSGGSDLFGQGSLKFNKLHITASGGSDVKMSLQASELDIQCSGGSDVVLDGFATYFKGQARGGSDIKASDLETEVCNISASGGSDVLIHVKDELTVSASGSSDIKYHGNPKKVDPSSSGGSGIKKR